MDINLSIAKICEGDPTYPYGYLYLSVTMEGGCLTAHRTIHRYDKNKAGALDAYRANLLSLERQLSDGIEEVRSLIEGLPAKVVEADLFGPSSW